MAEKINGGSIFGGTSSNMASELSKLNGQTIKGKVEITEGNETKKTIQDISKLEGAISTLSKTRKINIDDSKLTDEQKQVKAIAQAWLDIDKAAKQYAKSKNGNNGSFDKTKEEINSLVQSLETLSNAKLSLPIGGKELFSGFVSDKVASDQKKNVDSIVSSMTELKRAYEKSTREKYKSDMKLISEDEAKKTSQAFIQQADAAKKAGEQTGKAISDGASKSTKANKDAAVQAEKTAESYKKEAEAITKSSGSIKQASQKIQEIGLVAEEKIGLKEFERMIHISEDLKKELGGVYDVYLQIQKGAEGVYNVAYKLQGKNGASTWIGLNDGLLKKNMQLSSAATDIKKEEKIRDNLLLKEQINLYKELNKVHMKMAQNPGKAMTEELQRQENLIKEQLADVNVAMAKMSSQEVREQGMRNLLAEKVKFQREYNALLGEQQAKTKDKNEAAYVKQLEKQQQEANKQVEKQAAVKMAEMDQNKVSAYNSLLTEQLNIFKDINRLKLEKINTNDSNEIAALDKLIKERQEEYTAISKVVGITDDLNVKQQAAMNIQRELAQFKAKENEVYEKIGVKKYNQQQADVAKQQQVDMQRIANGDKNYINELWAVIDRQYQERLEAEKQQTQKDKEYQAELQGIMEEQHQEEVTKRKQQEKQDKAYLDEISGVMEAQRQAELAKHQAEVDRIAKADQLYNSDLNAVLGEQQAKKAQQVKMAKAGDKLFSDAQVKQMQEVVNKTKELWELRKSMTKVGSDAELQALIQQDERLAHTVALESERLKLFGDERAVILAEAKALEIQEKAIATINGKTNNQTRINNLAGSADKFKLGTQGMNGLYAGIDPLLSELDTSVQRIGALKAVSEQIINLPWQERVKAEKYLNEEYVKEKQNLDELKAKINGIKRDPAKKYVDETTISKQIAQMEDFYSKNDGASKRMREQLRGVIDETQKLAQAGHTLPKDFDPLVTKFNQIKTEMKRTGDTGMSIMSKLGRAWRSQMASQIAMYTSFYSLIRYAREAFNTIRELDTAMIDLSKTTKMSASEMGQFYYDANDAAKEYGVTTKELIDMASQWSRLGYNDKESSTEMAKMSAQFKMISPGMDVQQSMDGLVSSMKAFGIEVGNVEQEIMDKINVVGRIMPKRMVTYGIVITI